MYLKNDRTSTIFPQSAGNYCKGRDMVLRTFTNLYWL